MRPAPLYPDSHPSDHARHLLEGSHRMAKNRKPPMTLAGTERVLDLSSAGLPIPNPQELIARVSTFGWQETLLRLGALSGVLANHGGPEGIAARELTIEPLLGGDPARMTPHGRAFHAHLRAL